MLPNFIIIGAHKAGTSSLYKYLQQHPEIFMPTLKEPRFFCYDENNPSHVQSPRRVFPVRTMSEYEALFDLNKAYKAIGEASPEYLNSPIAAERIYNTIPNVKLIASLRHPVDKLYSAYQMNFRSGRTEQNFTDWFDAMLNEDDYSKQRLFYYENLKRYYDLFDNKQIKICLLDDIEHDVDAVVAAMFKFLDVSQDFSPDTSVKYNQGGQPKSKWQKLVKRLKLRKLLKPIVPASMLNLRKNLRPKTIEKYPPLDQSLRKELFSVFSDDVKKLEELIDRDLSIWYGN